MREINPKDFVLAQRSFFLALSIVLVISFTKLVLKIFFPVLILTVVIFFIFKFLYKRN